MTITEEQLQQLAEEAPGTNWREAEGGSYLVTVPNVALPEGWDSKVTSVHFVVPVGYPNSRPDCFWADSSLKLAGGSVPQNSGQTPLPGTANPLLWFSWHLESWNANSDTLLTYFRVILNRFKELR